MILSVPYPGACVSEDDTDLFHEWQLDKPSDILAVYFMIRNLDRWTNGGSRERAVRGVNTLLEDINKGERYQPWKLVGDLVSVLQCTRRTSTSPLAPTSPRP